MHCFIAFYYLLELGGSMNCEFIREGELLTLKPRGDIDHHLSSNIRDEIDYYIYKYGIKDILFDFANVNFMDSSGVGLIMGRYKKIKLIGGCIAVTNLRPGVERIFQISGLYKLVEIRRN